MSSTAIRSRSFSSSVVVGATRRGGFERAFEARDAVLQAVDGVAAGVGRRDGGAPPDELGQLVGKAVDVEGVAAGVLSTQRLPGQVFAAAVDDVANERRRDVGAQFPAGDALFDDRADDGRHLAVEFADHRVAVVAARAHFFDDQSAKLRRVFVAGQLPPDREPQSVARAAHAGQLVARLGDQRFVDRANGFVQQRALGRKVFVDGAFDDADGRGDVGHRRAVVAAFGEGAACGVDDLAASVGTAARARGRRFVGGGHRSSLRGVP